MKADRIKGHLDLVLLGVLDAGPAHGYAVIASLRERTDGALELQEGSVYPALHRLEKAGLLASDWAREAGRRRRVYRLTDAGRAAYRQERSVWRTLVSTIDAVIQFAPAPAGGAA